MKLFELTCDYCATVFDSSKTGIKVSAESGGVIIRINGTELRKADDTQMQFCSSDCFVKAEAATNWGYSDDELPLKDNARK